MYVCVCGCVWVCILTHEDMQEMKIDDIDPNSLFERSPYKEAYFAARAICPLIVALVFLVMFVLKLVLFFFTSLFFFLLRCPHCFPDTYRAFVVGRGCAEEGRDYSQKCEPRHIYSRK